MAFDDRRGDLAVRAFVRAIAERHELWLEHEGATTYLSAAYELGTPSPPLRGKGTLVFGVRGDCTLDSSPCRCVAASEVRATRIDR